jgi:hypothetical protein
MGPTCQWINWFFPFIFNRCPLSLLFNLSLYLPPSLSLSPFSQWWLDLVFAAWASSMAAGMVGPMRHTCTLPGAVGLARHPLNPLAPTRLSSAPSLLARQHRCSNRVSFHIVADQVVVGKKMSWERKRKRKSIPFLREERFLGIEKTDWERGWARWSVRTWVFISFSYIVAFRESSLAWVAHPLDWTEFSARYGCIMNNMF